MTNEYDPELDHTADVLTKVAERIAAASLMAIAEERDPVNPLVAVVENALMTGIALGLFAPDWARVMHEDASRAYLDITGEPSRMPGIVADITSDFPLGEAVT